MKTRLSRIVNVLIIDDDETDRMSIRRILARANPETRVIEASTGEAGRAHLEGGSFDCVFLDYRLPDMDGVSLLKRLYDVDADLMPCPVVMLTGQGNEGVMIEALRWGAHDYLVKDKISSDTLMIALIKAQEMFDLRKNRQLGEEKLRHAQKMDAVGQLTSGIAHDFNNLLSVILGNTHLLLRRLKPPAAEIDPPDLYEKVEAVDTAARKGADLVRHLMVFTRQRELKEDVLDCRKTLSETFALLKRTLSKRVELSEEYADDLWPLKVDAGLLENALINIAVNARDAMPEGGQLKVSARNVTGGEIAAGHAEVAPEDHVVITIADSGTGMPEHVRQRIFEPFFTTKPAGEGTGLGLSMVYGFIRQSGGHIRVDSTPGQGTSFYIYLRRHTAGDQAQVSQERAQ